MLLPINTERYTNIVQSDITLTYKNYDIQADFKPNYKNMFHNELSRPINYSEDNSIPIYDLNFTFLQTINMKSYDNVIEFLEKFNLLDFTYKKNTAVDDITYLSSEIIYNSVTNRKDKLSGDSIYLPPLLSALTNYNYKIGENKTQQIIQELITYLDLYSSVRFLSPIGQITKLNNDVITGFTNDSLSADFNKENIFNINNCFTEVPDYSITPEILPQNSVLNQYLKYPIKFSAIKDNKYMPSAYYNIAFMKNNRDPHYNINYIINDEHDYIYDYKISSNLDITYLNTEDKNNKFNNLFDIDITHSYEGNVTNKCLNKSVTTELINYAADCDLELSNNNIDNYRNLYPARMITKINDYLEPYENCHVANNKLYNIGELMGIRNYIKIRKFTR